MSGDSDAVAVPSWGGKISDLRDEVAVARNACLATDRVVSAYAEANSESFDAYTVGGDSFGSEEERTRRLVALGRLDQSLAIAEEAWNALCRSSDRTTRRLGPYGSR